MNYLHTSFNFLGILLLFFSCTKEVKQQKTIIAGTIDTIENGEIYLLSDYVIKDTIKVKKHNFHFLVDIDNKEEILLKKNNEYISTLVNPGDSIFIKKTPKTSIYSGSFKHENNLLEEINKRRIFVNPNEDAVNYSKKLDSVILLKNKIIDTFKEKNPDISEKFVKNLKHSFLYRDALNRLEYKKIIEKYFKKEVKNLSSDFYKNIDTLTLENPNLVHNFNYISYLNKVINNGFSKRTGKEFNSDQYFELIEFINDTLKNQRVKENLIHKKTYFNFSHLTEKFQDSLFDFYKKNITSNVILNKMSFTYNKYYNLRKGNKLPYWEAKDTLGNIHSINDFKGKWVYIDIWASWCGPCISEIPFLKKIENTYKNKNIEFVSLSTDRKKSSWKNALKKHKLTGNQFIISKKQIEKFNNDNMITGIPSFYLIDPEGKIYQKNPPRPSNKEGFNKLMNEIGLNQ